MDNMSRLKDTIRQDVTSISSAKRLAAEIDLQPPEVKARVALLSNYTITGLDACMKTQAYLHDIGVDCYTGAYGQWQQEILTNALQADQQEMIVLLLDLWGVDQHIAYAGHAMDVHELQGYMQGMLDELIEIVEHLKGQTRAKIVLANAPVPWNTVAGISDTKHLQSIARALQATNRALVDYAQEDRQLMIFDFDRWLGYIGKGQHWYTKYQFLGDMRLAPDAFVPLARELVSYLIPLKAKTKKCLVLDLDNTLWGGVIGEDGLAGIALNPTGRGQQFYEFQRLIKGLKDRGIILAINSKNNEEDALEVFRSHPHSVLKEDDFAAFRINWQQKAQNIVELAEELNIGTDSMVFVDDDYMNRTLVREVLPEVDVIDLPKDTSEYVNALLSYKGFSTFELTAEDRKRADMYVDQRKRKDFEKTSINMETFLAGLNLEVTMYVLRDDLLPRVAQLTQKTNQFNLTTRRYQEADIERMVADGAKIWAIDVKDRFGSYGVTGVVIVKDNPEYWEIDTFLMSCRVLGKHVERQFLLAVMAELHSIERKPVHATYVPTKKNAQTATFYEELGFDLLADEDGTTRWKRDLAQYTFKPIEYIALNIA